LIGQSLFGFSALPKTFLLTSPWVGYIGKPAVKESFALSRFDPFRKEFLRGRSSGIAPFMFHSRVAPKDAHKRIVLELVRICGLSTILIAARLYGVRHSVVAQVQR
jgi:hypothetical protein